MLEEILLRITKSVCLYLLFIIRLKTAYFLLIYINMYLIIQFPVFGFQSDSANLALAMLHVALKIISIEELDDFLY